MDIAIVSLALAVATTLLVLVNAGRRRTQERVVKDIASEAAVALWSAGEQSRKSLGELQHARAEANCHASQLEEATKAVWESVVEDTEPTGAEHLIPCNYMQWREDGDLHHVQVTGWANGGGFDLSLTINGAPLMAAMTWKEFDVMASLAKRLRVKDPNAPQAGQVLEATQGIDSGNACDGQEGDWVLNGQAMPCVDLELFWKEMVETAPQIHAEEEVAKPDTATPECSYDERWDSFHSE